MPQPNTEYYKEFSQGCKIYIESGTYRCGSLEIARSCDLFDEIHSIEVVPEFYEAAVEKYKNDSRVKLWLGYSPDVLRESILPNLNKRVTFWLDGHVCGDGVQPGVKAGFPLEPLDGAESLGKDVLEQIVGVLVVRGHVVNQPVKPWAVAHD